MEVEVTRRKMRRRGGRWVGGSLVLPAAKVSVSGAGLKEIRHNRVGPARDTSAVHALRLDSNGTVQRPCSVAGLVLQYSERRVMWGLYPTKWT